MKKIKVLILIFIIGFYPMSGVAEKTPGRIKLENLIVETISKASSFKDLVALFCQKEYEGKLGMNYAFREKVIKYTPKEYQKLRKLKDLYPYEWCLVDPLHIVESYRILELKQIDQKHAYAVVKYLQLGVVYGGSWEIHSKGGQPFFKKDKQDLLIKLNLEHDGTRWWIIDPPSPMVSHKTMCAYYEYDTNDIAQIVNTERFPGTGRKAKKSELERMKTIYQEHKQDLEILYSM